MFVPDQGPEVILSGVRSSIWNLQCIITPSSRSLLKPLRKKPQKHSTSLNSFHRTRVERHVQVRKKPDRSVYGKQKLCFLPALYFHSSPSWESECVTAVRHIVLELVSRKEVKLKKISQQSQWLKKGGKQRSFVFMCIFSGAPHTHSSFLPDYCLLVHLSLLQPVEPSTCFP